MNYIYFIFEEKFNCEAQQSNTLLRLLQYIIYLIRCTVLKVKNVTKVTLN